MHDLPWTPPNDSTWLSASSNGCDRQSDGSKPSWRGAFGSRSRSAPSRRIDSRKAGVKPPDAFSADKTLINSACNCNGNVPPPTLKFECKTGFPNTLTIPKADPGQPDVYDIDQTACLKLEQTIGLISIPKDHDVLFLLTTQAIMTDLRRVQSLLLHVDDYVQKCKPMWTNSWAVSFFTEKKYAGFLRDDEHKLHFEKGLWQQANIGQYSSQIRTLFRFPWSRKKPKRSTFPFINYDKTTNNFQSFPLPDYFNFPLPLRDRASNSSLPWPKSNSIFSAIAMLECGHFLA